MYREISFGSFNANRKKGNLVVADTEVEASLWALIDPKFGKNRKLIGAR